MDEVLVKAIESIAARVGGIEERSLRELMLRSGFDDCTIMQENGYRAVREQHGNGDVYWVDVDRVKVPAIRIVSSGASE